MCHTTNTSNCDSNDELTENTVPSTEPNTESQAGQFIRKSLLLSDLFGKTFEPPVGPSEACPVVLAQDAEETTTRSRFRTLLDWPHWTSAMWVSLLLGLGTCIGVAWYDSPSNTAVLPAGEIGTVGGASLVRPEVEGWAGYAPSLLEISRVRVGMRVAAENPEVSDAERKNFVDPDPTTWRFLKLRLPKSANVLDFVDIDMLRPLEWLEQQRAVVGGRVFLDLEELGAKGLADVLEIGPCPEIVPGPGSVVTATFAHQPTSEILDVTVTAADGSEETIGVTANHPFWSVDHLSFVPVGHLAPGTRVKTHLDQIQTIVSLLPRPGPAERVYNLEVHGEHVYYVGESLVLVHNSYPTATAIGRMDDVKMFDGVDAIDTWRKTGPAGNLPNGRVSWTQNRKWLDERIARGDTFYLVTDPKKLSSTYTDGVPNGHFTYLEIQYLEKRGIEILHLY